MNLTQFIILYLFVYIVVSMVAPKSSERVNVARSFLITLIISMLCKCREYYCAPGFNGKPVSFRYEGDQERFACGGVEEPEELEELDESEENYINQEYYGKNREYYTPCTSCG